MVSDITIQDYYHQFIHNANKDIKTYEQIAKDIIKDKEEHYNHIKDYVSFVRNSFKVDLNTIEEWSTKKYNDKEYLYQLFMKFIKDETDEKKKRIALAILKYCNVLRRENNNNKNLEFAIRQSKLAFKDYRNYTSMYSNKIHKCVLKGMGYKFGYGTGIYVINHWKIDKKLSKKRPSIDYAETNRRKKELLAKGVKLYDKKEAAWYKARHIPYDAVDYRVYRNDSSWYEFTFINSKIAGGSKLDYKRSEYVSSKYREMSYKDMANALCKTEEDVYDLQLDIKYKLNILLYKNPNIYLNYIRNAEQDKYKPGAHNSKNR